jgi:hypothetical protein
MGMFSTRNSDGAHTPEPSDTISKKEMDRLAEIARRHNRAKQEVFSDAGDKYRKAHQRGKAGTN